MFLINISPWLWDIFILFIILTGVILAFVCSFRTVLIMLFGNLVSIALAFSFKGLILPRLTSGLQTALHWKMSMIQSYWLAHDLAVVIYFGSWIIGITLIIVITKHILKMLGIDIFIRVITILLKIVTFQKIWKWKNGIVKKIMAIIINFIRFSFIAGFLTLTMGSNIFITKNSDIPNYYSNQIHQKAISYLIFSKFAPNFELTKVSNTDWTNLLELNNQKAKTIYFTKQFPLVDHEHQHELVQKFIKYYQLTDKDEQDIMMNWQKYVDAEWTNLLLLNQYLSMMKHFLNIYPEMSSDFIKVFSEYQVKFLNKTDLIRVKIVEFCEQLPTLELKNQMKQTLFNFYQIKTVMNS